MSTQLYTITIKNESSSGSKVYNIYSDQPLVEGGGVQSTHSVIWFKTNALGKGAQFAFKYTPDFYGLIGSSDENSDSLKVGNEVSMESNLLAKIGTYNNDGSILHVNDSLELHALDGLKVGAADSTFMISAVTGIDSPNTYVVGVGRKQDKGDVAPVAVVELKANVTYKFTPKTAVFVKATNLAPGVVNNFAAAKDDAKVEFRGLNSHAIVTEQNNGKFTITYK